MTKQRDLKLNDGYEISPARYRELLYFCRQYPEWKTELAANTDAVRALPLTKMPGAPIRKPSDQTGELAARRADLARKCELVEQAAIEADGAIYQYIIRNVTQDGVGYYFLSRLKDDPIPCGKGYFYRARRRFFYLLNQNRG